MNNLTLLEKLTDKFELVLGYAVDYQDKYPVVKVHIRSTIHVDIKFTEDRNSIISIEIVDNIDDDSTTYSVLDAAWIYNKLSAIFMMLSEIMINSSNIEVLSKREYKYVNTLVMRSEFMLKRNSEIEPYTPINKED